jgi:hypothetical protein
MKVITGAGRCYSSFITLLIQKAGGDVGGIKYRWFDKIRAGMEHAKFAELNEKILNETHDLKELKEFDPGCEIVKDPRFIFTAGEWLKVRNDFEVLLLKRDTDEQYISMLDSKIRMLSLFENPHDIGYKINKFKELMISNNIKVLELEVPGCFDNLVTTSLTLLNNGYIKNPNQFIQNFFMLWAK